ncbi:MAG TPA: pilus assembly protein [Novosphingobium sp.]|nr:pilus assembly protein [Novosphingobium sp.]
MFIHRQRMEARTVVAVEAVMRIADRRAEATLVNASSRGVLALVSSPPPRGTLIELEIGDHVLKGQVRWRGHDRCGIALKSQVSVVDLIEGKAVPLVQVPERLSRRRPLDIFRAMLG